MKILPCAVRSALSGVMIAIGGYAFLGCENRVVGAILFTVGLITITLFGFDLYTGRIGYFPVQSRTERLQTLLSLPGNAVGCLLAGLARKPAGAVQALCEARLAKDFSTLLADGIFCGILIFICVEIYKTRGTVLGILICIPTFILCGFEHSVADIFYFVNARIFSWQAVGVVLAVALGNALGALLIPAALRALPLPPHKPLLPPTPPPAQTPHFDPFVQKSPTRRLLPMGFFPFGALQWE